MWISGFLIVGEIGRTLPKKPELPLVNGSSEAGVGEFGYAWRTEQACWSAVPSVLSGTAEARLPVVFVRAASGNKTVRLQAPSFDIRILYSPSPECTVFDVISETIVEGDVLPDLPRILEVGAVDVVCHVDEARPSSHGKLRGALIERRTGLFSVECLITS